MVDRGECVRGSGRARQSSVSTHTPERRRVDRRRHRRHALDLRSLRLPGARLWTAVDGVIVGTGALVELEPGHEELKSRRTDPA